jgi:hypothetical protein
MNVRGNLLLLVTVAAMAATPAVGQDVAPAVRAAGTVTQSAASVPDFSAMWAHPYNPGFERYPALARSDA